MVYELQNLIKTKKGVFRTKREVFIIKYSKIWMLILFCILISSTIFSQNSLLVLNSYNPGLSWSDEELNGLFSVLNNREDLEVYVEFLDSKRFGDDDSLEIFKDYLFKKLGNIQFKAVVAVDNDAFDFVLENYESFLRGFLLYFVESIIFKNMT